MKSCLVVDDQSVIRKVSRVFLEQLGYEVMEAETADEALNRCRAGIPDVIILDWQLPGMSALEFLSALRVTFSGKRPFVIYSTTENDAMDISRAFSAGADDYMMKPFDREMFVTKFAELSRAA